MCSSTITRAESPHVVFKIGVQECVDRGDGLDFRNRQAIVPTSTQLPKSSPIAFGTTYGLNPLDVYSQ